MENVGLAMVGHEPNVTETALREAKSDSTERKLLDAAARAFKYHGYTATSIRVIAKDAGLTIGALYHYADGKEALFLRLVNDGYTRSIAAARAVAAQYEEPEERLLALVRMHVSGEVAERDLWRLSRTELNALTPDSQAKIIALRDAFESVWNEAILDGCSKGCFWPRDSAIARLSVVRMCTSVGDWYDPKGRLSLEEIVELMCRQTMDIMRPAGASRNARAASGSPT